MKKAIIFLSALICLVGCAQQRMQEALKACHNPGIDVSAPSFSPQNSPRAVNAFYSCEISAVSSNGGLKFKTDHALAKLTGNDIPELDDLQYQQMLWSQVFTGQKTPEGAQEAWLLWQRQGASRAVSAASASNHQQNMTCMANGPFVNCNGY